MKTPLLINLFDFYGKDIPLQIFSAAKKKSLFGAIMGVLSLASIGVISIYFLMTLFSRDTKQIISSQSATLIPQNDLTAIPFFVVIMDSMTRWIPPDAGIYEAHAFFLYQKWSNNTYQGLDITPIQLEPCTKQHAGVFTVPDASLAISMCVPNGKYNLTINSIMGDTINDSSWLTFYLTKCNPKKTRIAKMKL